MKSKELKTTKIKPKKKRIRDPRWDVFWQYYLTPGSQTFGNALRSALQAQFSETFAKTITTQFREEDSEKLRRFRLYNKAVENIERMLDLPETTIKTTDKGDQIEVDSPTKIQVKADMSKFVAERLGKEHWSARREITGPDGEDLLPAEQTKLNKLFKDNVRSNKRN